MASPCEVLLEVEDGMLARQMADMAAAEAGRIEAKYSRYRDDSIVSELHRERGHRFVVDNETSQLLSLAARCHELSNGRFDITSGVLRRVWTFDGSDRIPSRKQVKSVLPYVGWHRVRWEPPEILLPEEMQIDLGGIGKEYAVDRVAGLLASELQAPFLVNFGGDLRVSGARRGGSAWRVGVEDPGARTARNSSSRSARVAWPQVGTPGAICSRMECATRTSSTRAPVGRSARRRDRSASWLAPVSKRAFWPLLPCCRVVTPRPISRRRA